MAISRNSRTTSNKTEGADAPDAPDPSPQAKDGGAAAQDAPAQPKDDDDDGEEQDPAHEPPGPSGRKLGHIDLKEIDKPRVSTARAEERIFFALAICYVGTRKKPYTPGDKVTGLGAADVKRLLEQKALREVFE